MPRIAIVTRSLDLDTATTLFTESDLPPIVITCGSADAARRAALAEVAELIVVGEEAVDLPAALTTLRAGGAEVVTCEGGPSLNGDLVAGDLVDEWDLTVSPLLVSGKAGSLQPRSPPPGAARHAARPAARGGPPPAHPVDPHPLIIGALPIGPSGAWARCAWRAG